MNDQVLTRTFLSTVPAAPPRGSASAGLPSCYYLSHSLTYVALTA